MSSAGAAKPGPPPGALQFLQKGAGFARPSGQGLGDVRGTEHGPLEFL